MIQKILALACAFVLLAAMPLRVLAEDGVQLTVQSGDFSMLENDRMKARFTVASQSAEQTVKSFEMRVYAVDAKGKRIWGEDTYYYWITKKEIAPGQSGSSDYVTLPDCSQVAQLYAAVSKVSYTDGTASEMADGQLNYRCWDVE